MDLERASSQEYISQYVLECRKQGLFLSADDQAVVSHWLKSARGDTRRLLLALHEVLPNYFESGGGRRPLRYLNQTVQKKISALDNA